MDFDQYDSGEYTPISSADGACDHRFNGLWMLMMAALVLLGLLGLNVVDSVEKMIISMALLSLVVSAVLGWCLRGEMPDEKGVVFLYQRLFYLFSNEW